MKLLLALLLVACARAAGSIYSLIALDGAAKDPDQLRSALRHAYQKHIVGGSNSKGHMVSLWVSGSAALTWTDANANAESILYAIEHVELRALTQEELRDCSRAYSFADVLGAIRESPENAGSLTNIYFVVDEARDSADPKESVAASVSLTRGGSVQVYPLGVGKCVQTQDLKRISGPCHPLFGCHSPFAYYQSKTYNGIQRARSEVKAARLSKRHAITTEEGLTGVQLAITIILCVLVGVLTLWCLLYSLCYLPRSMQPADAYRVLNPQKRGGLIQPREKLF